MKISAKISTKFGGELKQLGFQYDLKSVTGLGCHKILIIGSKTRAIIVQFLIYKLILVTAGNCWEGPDRREAPSKPDRNCPDGGHRKRDGARAIVRNVPDAGAQLDRSHPGPVVLRVLLHPHVGGRQGGHGVGHVKRRSKNRCCRKLPFTFWPRTSRTRNLTFQSQPDSPESSITIDS